MVKRLIYIGLILTFSGSAFGQRARLAPDFVAGQYAGSIGFASAGAGYDVFKKKADWSLHYGYVPEVKGGELHIVSTKLLFNTWSFEVSENIKADPLAVGIMFVYNFGSNFKSHWPEHRYPEGYYWWRTSLRGHIVTQSSLSFKVKDKHIDSVTLYVEFNTNELYLVSYIQNRDALSWRDIIKAGYGVRLNF